MPSLGLQTRCLDLVSLGGHIIGSSLLADISVWSPGTLLRLVCNFLRQYEMYQQMLCSFDNV